MTIQPIPVDLQKEDWKEILKKPLPQRSRYQFEQDDLIFEQVAGLFLGCPIDEENYLEELYELAYESDFPVVLLSETLDKTIANETFRAVQKIMMIHQEQKGLSVNRFVAFMEGETLFPLKERPVIYRHLRVCFIKMLAHFEKHHPNGLMDSNLRRVVVDTVKWTKNHIEKWLKQDDLAERVPAIIWYGDATESQAYFLYFLILLGFDVLIFHPEGKNSLSAIGVQGLSVHTYPSTMKLVPFPHTRPARKSTVAKKASQELDEVLHSDQSLLYKPWQFRNYLPEVITLKTTYDEIFLIAKEKAFIRPNFKAANGRIYIPSLFAKVCGISANQKEFWSRLQDLKDQEMTEVITRFPFTPEPRGSQLFHYREALKNGVLDPDHMVHAAWWRYKHLPNGLQFGMASVISRYVELAAINRREDETLEDLKVYLFSVALAIPERFVRLLQQFDYSQTVPQMIVFNDGKSGKLSREDAALLLLMNEMGLDVICYNPTGENDLEFYLEPKLFDSHWLEEVSFDASYDSRISTSGSLFKKLFNKLL
ncbi:YceG family protein [Pullulanibacillus sp. KACC 23026]|uniref:YceG family protein n=1 Tax=Pullulanibacillus sp. KACC 23026 TaxID=3028315 RepID=UPI0023B01EF1|nr:YceG family protein [Pullulanibacillus sp. KACC 23026]WEG12972.1 YceG family protein [Pullulanibacillus sp. KACC 23026]